MEKVVKLLCPLCLKEGRTGPIEVGTDFVRIPALLKRWVPSWARGKGFISLEEAVEKDASFAALIEKIDGRSEARGLCVQHGYLLRDAKIWTEKMSLVQERRAAAAERKALAAFGSIGSILGGQQKIAAGQSTGVEPEGEDAGAQARAEQEEVQRKLAAEARAREAAEAAEAEGKAKPKGKGKGKKEPKPKSSTKGRSKGALRKEIDEALEGDAS